MPGSDMPASSMAPMQNASRPRGHPEGRLVEIGGSRRLEQAAGWNRLRCKRNDTCLRLGYKMIIVHFIAVLCWRMDVALRESSNVCLLS